MGSATPRQILEGILRKKKNGHAVLQGKTSKGRGWEEFSGHRAKLRRRQQESRSVGMSIGGLWGGGVGGVWGLVCEGGGGGGCGGGGSKFFCRMIPGKLHTGRMSAKRKEGLSGGLGAFSYDWRITQKVLRRRGAANSLKKSLFQSKTSLQKR